MKDWVLEIEISVFCPVQICPFVLVNNKYH